MVNVQYVPSGPYVPAPALARIGNYLNARGVGTDAIRRRVREASLTHVGTFVRWLEQDAGRVGGLTEGARRESVSDQRLNMMEPTQSHESRVCLAAYALAGKEIW